MFRPLASFTRLAPVTGWVAPVIGILLFLMFWQTVSGRIQTSTGEFPGPADVWRQSVHLLDEHRAERNRRALLQDQWQQEKTADYHATPHYEPRPTFFEQAATSVITVMAGFGLAAVIAVPVGIAVGLSNVLYQALNPLIQLFKPVSPLAWLPLVTLVAGTGYGSADSLLPQSFLVSMITVLLCCLWPTVINTSIGVAGVEADWLNVSRVLRLDAFTHLRRIVLPAAAPAIFTGLRISLGIAWMVLVAAEMLARSPGLGQFIWEEFQSGGQHSLARILTAVIAIGLIGFLLDRAMLTVQRAVSWDHRAAIR